jgi:hypothetical protein
MTSEQDDSAGGMTSYPKHKGIGKIDKAFSVIFICNCEQSFLDTFNGAVSERLTYHRYHIKNKKRINNFYMHFQLNEGHYINDYKIVKEYDTSKSLKFIHEQTTLMLENLSDITTYKCELNKK